MRVSRVLCAATALLLVGAACADPSEKVRNAGKERPRGVVQAIGAAIDAIDGAKPGTRERIQTACDELDRVSGNALLNPVNIPKQQAILSANEAAGHCLRFLLPGAPRSALALVRQQMIAVRSEFA